VRALGPVMKLLHSLGDETDVPGGVSRASFMAGALRQLSVGLIGELLVVVSCLCRHACRSSRSSSRAGLSVPTDEHAEWYAQCLSVSPVHRLTCCDCECLAKTECTCAECFAMLCVSVSTYQIILLKNGILHNWNTGKNRAQ
jgi:hypothetical protein